MRKRKNIIQSGREARRLARGVLCGIGLAALPALAEVTQLPDVVVKGQAFAPENSAYTANVLEQDIIRERQAPRLQDMFRDVPGLAIRGFNLGGVADSVSMRGFGGGMHGGDIGLAIDGIPLNEAMSHADGYADQNVIVPLEIERTTIYKGPVSALYGNFNRAGMMSVESRKSGEYREIDVQAGSFSTFDAQAALGTRWGNVQGNFAAQLYSTEGFREQSDYRRGTLAGRLGFDLGEGAQLAVSARLHSGRWDSAAYITAAQNADGGRRFDKDPRVQNDGGDKDFITGRIDYSKTLTPDLRLLVFAYGTGQTFSRYFTRPTGATWEQRLEDYDRSVRGLGFSLNGLARPAGKPLNWVVGMEGFHESTLYRYKDALSFREETATTVGGTKPYLNRDYVTNSTSAFAQGEWALAPQFRPAVGLRHDRFGGDCDIKGVEIAAGAGNPCNSMHRYSHTSPKFGVRSTWSPAVDTRLSLAEGFQLPPAAARYGTSGIQPTLILQKEAGLTLKPARGVLIDVALFRIDTRNEARDLGGGVYQNFGRNRRDGLEVELQWAPNDALELGAALTWLDTRVLEHATAAVMGKSIPGAPERTATLRGRYRFGAGWWAELVVQNQQRLPVDSLNNAWLGGFTLADLTVGWQRPGVVRQRFFATVRNLTNRDFATSSFVSSGTQLYAPGAPRHLMLGLSMDI